MNKEELKKELQKIVERIHMDGWERGKEQHKTPYNFTLTNSDWLEKQWQKILDLFPKSEQVITSGTDKIIMINSGPDRNPPETPEPKFISEHAGRVQQVITEEDIVEVLEKYNSFPSHIKSSNPFNDGDGGEYFEWDDRNKQIASEILKSKWEIVASGMMDYDDHYKDRNYINGESINSKFKKYDGKDCDVAVRVKEGKCH